MPEPTTPAADAPLRFSRFITALVVAEMVVAFDTAMFFGAVGDLLRTFRSPQAIAWMLTAFFLTQAVAGAICARLGDVFGRRKVMVVMLALVLIGSLVSGTADSAAGVIAGRALQGFAAAILPLCFGVVRENLAADRAKMTIGVLAAAAGVLGGGGGLLLGGAVTQAFSWRGVFWLVALLAAVAIALVLWAVPGRRPQKVDGPLDLFGGVLFAPAIAGLLLAVNAAKAWGWIDGRTIALLVGSLAVLGFWIRHELRRDNPLLDVRLLARPAFLLTGLISVCLALGTYQYAQVMFQLFEQPAATGAGFGLTPSLAGLILAGAMVLSFAGGPLAGVLGRRSGAIRPLQVGAWIITAAWLLLSLNHRDLRVVVGLLVVQTFGMTLLISALNIAIVDAAPADRTSEALGLNAVLRATTQGIGAQVIAAIFVSFPVDVGGRPLPADAAYGWAFAYMGATALICALATVLTPLARKSGLAAA